MHSKQLVQLQQHLNLSLVDPILLAKKILVQQIETEKPRSQTLYCAVLFSTEEFAPCSRDCIIPQSLPSQLYMHICIQEGHVCPCPYTETRSFGRSQQLGEFPKVAFSYLKFSLEFCMHVNFRQGDCKKKTTFVKFQWSPVPGSFRGEILEMFLKQNSMLDQCSDRSGSVDVCFCYEGNCEKGRVFRKEVMG